MLAEKLVETPGPVQKFEIWKAQLIGLASTAVCALNRHAVILEARLVRPRSYSRSFHETWGFPRTR